MNSVAAPPSITLTICDSSQIESHGHCPVSNTLRLRFKKGGEPGDHVYDYPCSVEEYAAFCAAPSKGKHFGQHFKNNPKHPHTKRPADLHARY